MLEEGHKGSGRWVWIGSSFYDVGGLQNAPIEARADNMPPLNRIIKTRGGNRLELDDRQTDMRGEITYGVRLMTGDRDGLDVTKGKGIRLGFGNKGGQLFLGNRGIKLISNDGSGLYVNDKLESIRLVTKSEKVWQNWFDGKITQFAEGGINILSNSRWDLAANKGIKLSTRGGELEFRSNSTKIVTVGDIKIQSGNNFNVNANQYNITGLAGSNMLVDLPVPGDGTLAGNIVVNTAGGNVLLRSGVLPPFPGSPPASSGTMLTNDPLFGVSAGRIGIGVAGHALLEGKSGGIWVSPIPLSFPGTAGGLGGRPLAPLAPIQPAPAVPVVQPPLSPSTPPTPTSVGLGPQPMVLGNNLLFTLQKLVLNLFNLFSVMSQNSSAFAMSPMGPAVLNPLVIQQLSINISEMQAILNTNLGAPAPSGILSSLAFVDG